MIATLFYTVLYYSVLFCTVLNSSILYCTIVYYIYISVSAAKVNTIVTHNQVWKTVVTCYVETYHNTLITRDYGFCNLNMCISVHWQLSVPFIHILIRQLSDMTEERSGRCFHNKSVWQTKNMECEYPFSYLGCRERRLSYLRRKISLR